MDRCQHAWSAGASSQVWLASYTQAADGPITSRPLAAGYVDVNIVLSKSLVGNRESPFARLPVLTTVTVVRTTSSKGKPYMYHRLQSLLLVPVIPLLALIAGTLAVMGCEKGVDASLPPLSVTVEEVYQAYEQNEARANATYKERPLNLSFRVDEIEDAYVAQELGFLASAHLEFNETDLIRFNIGDTGRRICELDGLLLDILLRFDCR